MQVDGSDTDSLHGSVAILVQVQAEDLPPQAKVGLHAQVALTKSVGYQQNRVPHFYHKTTHQDKNYGPQPITAGRGLTPLKTKAKGQAPEPPSAHILRLTPLYLVRPPRCHPGA
jgi:hypothetical protein